MRLKRKAYPESKITNYVYMWIQKKVVPKTNILFRLALKIKYMHKHFIYIYN